MDPQLLKKARQHLLRRDAILKNLIRHVGPCTLQHDSDHFGVLTRSIISQQISTLAAKAIGARLLEKLGRFQPQRILAASDDDLRAAGLSQSKRRSLRELAERCQSGVIPLKKLANMDDEAVSEALVQVHGIGPWTAEMFLIFSLGWLDILPVGDYGLRAGLQKHYALPEMPKKAEMIELTQTWQPYRSIGTWYIWRSAGFVPQSEAK